MLVWLTFGCAAAIGQVDQTSLDDHVPPLVSAPTRPADCPCTCRSKGGWTIVETPNFAIWTHQSGAATEQLARACEAQRADLRNSWLGEIVETAWQPRCVVVVHTNTTEFARHAGGSLRVPVGSTTITRDHGRIIFRRIDLRSDAADWRSNALPHELTHVALADAVPERDLPAWLNEGVAMTFETRKLQQRRLEVLRSHYERGTLPALRSIFTTDDLPPSLDADSLYATCLSVVSYLRSQGDGAQLIRFAGEAARIGCDPALRRVYNIGGTAELEQRWLAAFQAEAGTVSIGGNDTKTAPRHPSRGNAGRHVRSIAPGAVAEPVTDGRLPGFAAPASPSRHTSIVPDGQDNLPVLSLEPAAGPQTTLDRVTGRPLG